MSKQIPPTKDAPPILEASKVLNPSPRNNFSIGNFSRGIFGALFGPGILFGAALNIALIYLPTKFLYVTDLKSRKAKGSLIKTFFSNDRGLEGLTSFIEGTFGVVTKKLFQEPYQNLFKESKNLLTSSSTAPISFEQLEPQDLKSLKK